MMYGPVPLERYFSLVDSSESDSDEQDFSSFFGGSTRTTWTDLEAQFRCVILAEAGAGKSFEMEARAEHAQELGRVAFFIRIEDIADGFEEAFEVGSVESFEDWLNSQEEAWFFLDSVDEARLNNPQAFEKAIRRFSTKIQKVLHRAHIFISSRPYAWRACSDRTLVERYLPFKKPNSEKSGYADCVSETVDANEAIKDKSSLSIYMLDPLDETGIRKFASYRGAPEVDRLIIELQRANLMSMAARPFDLDGILGKWGSDQSLDGRLELLQHNIDLRLREIDPTRAQRQPLNREKARRGARVLAAAVVLTGAPGIRIPDSTFSGKGIDAETVLGDEWTPAEIQALLERGIFNDAIYGAVRFRHRDIRELLAAEWFSHQLMRGNSRHTTEAFFLREQYGHWVITPRLRSVLSWLILFDDDLRKKTLKISPEIAVEGGDAAHLPFSERQNLLYEIVKRIVLEDNPSAQDNSAIARIAQVDLSNDTLGLIMQYQDNEDAIFFLGRLVWQGGMTDCVTALSEIAMDSTKGMSARVAATRAVMTCGSRHQQDNLWNLLNKAKEILPRRLLAEILEEAAADFASVDFLLSSIDKVEPYEQYTATGLSQALHKFIDRLPIHEVGESAPLSAIIDGLNNFIDREPYIERRECEVSEKFIWLLGPATHAVERLVSSHSEKALSSEALSIMLKVPMARSWRGDDFNEYKSRLHEIVPTWKELNDSLFWRNVGEVRVRLSAKKSEQLTDFWRVRCHDHYWKFDIERILDVLGFIESRSFLDDKLVAQSLAYDLLMDANKLDDWSHKLKEVADDNPVLLEELESLLNPTKLQSALDWEEEDARDRAERKKQQEDNDRERAEWIECLKVTPDIVRYPQGLNPGDLSYDQCQLVREIESFKVGFNRIGGANWKSLIKEFGEDVAQAYRDAAISHWRNFTPGLRSEGYDTNSITLSLIFAMAGLEIEASEMDSFPSNLIEAEVQHALRYFVRELNGFPTWFEEMYRVYPVLVMNVVSAELQWELSHTKVDQSMHYVLHDLAYYAPWLHQYLAPLITVWIEKNEIINPDVLRYCIHILHGGNVGREIISKLAQEKISSNTECEQLAVWFSLWVSVSAGEAIPAVEKWLENHSGAEASQKAQLFITKLLGGRSAEVVVDFNDYRKVSHLKKLYVLMHQYIRVEDDIERISGKVYSPGLRDNAQDCRSMLFTLLSEIPGKETYVALMELSDEHPNTKYKPWMQQRAYKRAEEDADLELWSAQQVREYDQYQTSTPTTHRQLFDLTVDRLIDLKACLEQGNNSPYKTWQRVEGETEMRNLVTGWLNDRSFGRYTCAQENELPNRQRPDIWVQKSHVLSPVPIELKLLDKGWSGPELCERLRNQLAGDYLREATAGCGVMLLIWQGQSAQSSWQIDGQSVPLVKLENTLKSYWHEVANNFPNVEAIEVILIDLTVRDLKSAT